MVLTAVGNDWGLFPTNNSNNLTIQADVALINNAIQLFGTTSTSFQANLVCQHVDGVGADVIPSQDGFLLHVPFPCWATIMGKVMRDGDFPSLLCMSDTVKLAMAVRALSQRRITDIIATKKTHHFKHSESANSRLQSIHKQLGQPLKKLQQDEDVPSTWWNSTWFELQSLLEQKCALCAYGLDYHLPCMFTSSQWKLV